MTRSAVLWIIALSLAGCNPGHNLAPLPEPAVAGVPYQLGSGDRVRVITFGEDALSGEFRVNDGGGVAMPLLGIVPAAGTTPEAFAARIGEELRRRQIVSKPDVSVEVVSYRPVFILGEVNKPGEYPFQPGMTLLSAVSTAGGFTYRAVEDYASIVRRVDGRPLEGRVTRQAVVEPGDVVTVFERRY